MGIKIQSVLLGSAISGALTLLLALKLFSILIVPTLPGWLLAWGTTIALGGKNWKHGDAMGVALVTIGNAVFYGWICFLILRRGKRTVEHGESEGDKP